MSKPRFRQAPVGGCVAADVEQCSDGSWLLRSKEPLAPYPVRLTDRLEHFASVTPNRTFVAQRDETGAWKHVTYAEMLSHARAVGAALVERRLNVERSIAILSGNSIDHLTLAMGALWAGIPYTPVSPAYSLISSDFGKLRHVLGKITPGLVYASDPSFAKAIGAAVGPEVDVVLSKGQLEGRKTTPFSHLLETAPGVGLDEAHSKVGPDTIGKFLFTSGSTKAPKGVINTHRMMCANLQMLLQVFTFFAEEPPVLVDWLPWNHTFGGNHNVGIVLYNGGTLYIDDGKPTPTGIGETLRNLREISPTVYFNVPRGFEEIASAMERDNDLRQSLFKRVRMFMFAGAGLAQSVWDRLDQLAELTIGERIPMFTGLGMTETSPTSTFAVRVGEVASGHIGLPVPGVEAKLVPIDGKLEVRFRGPHVTPGYYREPELTQAAFDEEGFYRTGDAVTFLDESDLQKGMRFDGRLAEDFKLTSGTFVSVGPLRAKVAMLGAPCVQDSVVTGINRDEVGLLVFPNLDGCRKLAKLAADAPSNEVLEHPAIATFFRILTQRLWDSGTGSASRVSRLCVMKTPPSIDLGEITDKGSINQRAVLSHREALVSDLYAGVPTSDPVFVPRREV